MAGLRESIQTNRKLLIATIALVTVLIGFLGKFYIDQKRENQSLKLKLMLMSENRKTPKAWSELTRKAPVASTSALVVKAPEAAIEAETVTTEAQIALSEQDTQTLAVKLDEQMRRVRDLDAAALDNNISIADEIISREPDSYSAYKAKLISLLTKEGKFNLEADDSEIEGLLESMAQFNFTSDSVARREAALISNANSEREGIEMQIEDLSAEREALEVQLEGLDPNSAEFTNLNTQIQSLERRQGELLGMVENLGARVSDQSAQLANEDVIEIPFMRMLAKNDYEGVIANAQSFIEQFPNSPSGYFYLTKALELQGNREEALNVIQNSTLPGDTQTSFIQRLESESKEDPKAYWQKLDF